jgi:chemotaxis protein methyltransferase CheR
MRAESDRAAAPPETQLVLEAIRARYGYDLRGYAPASIHRRIGRALAKSGLPGTVALTERLLDDPEFFAEMLEDLTVRVSEMFRDPPFYRAFRDRVLPLLSRAPRLNLWLAGCASGEEAYSMAILLSEAGLYDRCQIYATDLSARALEQAQQGVYPVSSLRVFADNYRRFGGPADPAAYTTAAYDRIAFRRSLRRNISFFRHDLVGDHLFAEMQVILCRNVLIYFGPDLKQRVIEQLSRSLCPGGFFCLGTSEQLSRAATAHFTPFAAEDRIYRRIHQEARAA